MKCSHTYSDDVNEVGDVFFCLCPCLVLWYSKGRCVFVCEHGMAINPSLNGALSSRICPHMTEVGFLRLGERGTVCVCWSGEVLPLLTPFRSHRVQDL